MSDRASGQPVRRGNSATRSWDGDTDPCLAMVPLDRGRGAGHRPALRGQARRGSGDRTGPGS